jgi:hypothetical protein
MFSQDRARYEQSLATAHRALWAAQESAELLNDYGAHDACYDMLVDIVRLQESSLKGNLKVPKGQLKLC